MAKSLFVDRLLDRIEAVGAPVCVGLDPVVDRLPNWATGSSEAERVSAFCRGVIDRTAEVAAAFKPQSACFERLGWAGFRALEETVAHARAAGVPVVYDAKRGDIGSTADHYAREAFLRYGAHAVTVNPYLGTDSIEPFFDTDNNPEGGGVILLCRTSNPGGDDLQSLVADGRPVYAHVAERAANDWSKLGDLALVVGATYPTELADVRAIVGDMPLLVPGVGAQGGDAAAVVEHGASAARRGLIVSSSRAILYAGSGDDFAEAARAEALRTASTLHC